jgi:hypothetical protein
MTSSQKGKNWTIVLKTNCNLLEKFLHKYTHRTQFFDFYLFQIVIVEDLLILADWKVAGSLNFFADGT